MKRILLALGAILLLFVLYSGIVEPYWLNKVRLSGTLPNLPAAWEGKKVGVVSDFQIGMWLDNKRTARNAVDHLIAEQVDLVLMPGDFLYEARQGNADEIGQVVELIEPLTAAGLPVYAVLGNHDYLINWQADADDFKIADELISRMEASGVNVLRNESVQLSPDGAEPLYIVGVDANWANLDDTRAALDGVPENAARIALMHNPVTFKSFEAGEAPLAVAGHTHCSQVRIPMLTTRDWLNILRENEILLAGWAPADYGQGENRLYVGCGIGFSTLPLRFNARPEVTIFELRSE